MDYDSPASGIPSPPVSCPPSPSSFASDPESLPSNLSASVFSLLSRSPGSPLNRVQHLTYGNSGFSSHEHLDHNSNLVMPSLALPGPLHQHPSTESSSAHGRGRRRATSQSSKGELVGKLNILVIGKLGAGKTTFCQSLVAGTEEVVHIAGWEDARQGRVLHASTIVSEQHESNVKIVRVPGWNDNDDVEPVLASILHTIEDPFRELDQVLDPKHKDPSASLKALLSSSATPLYTVAVFLHSNPPTPLENQLLSALSPAIPIIPFASQRLHDHPVYSRHHSPHLSRTPSYHDFRSHDSSRVHSQTSSLVSSPYGSRNHSRHDSRGRPLSLSRPISRSRSPELPKLLPRAQFHPRSLHELRDIIFRSPASVEILRRDATEKFLSWRSMERLIDEFTHLPSSTVKAPKDLLGNGDAFERFTFDLILDAAEEDSEDEHDGLGELPRGRGIGRKSLHSSSLAGDLSLSQTVAIRKRAILQHRDTGMTLRPPPSSESSPGLPPLEDTVRGRSYTIRPVKGPGRPMIRVPLSELPISGDHPLASLSSRSGSVTNSAYVSAVSSRSSSKTPSSGTPLSGSISASQPFESEPEDDDDGSHFGLYHGYPPRKGRDDLMRSIRDPLHLPSLFSLAVSLVPDMKRRLLRKIHPLMLLRRALGISDSNASSSTTTTASTCTPEDSNVESTWQSSNPAQSGGSGLRSTLMFGFACFCAGLGLGVVLANEWTKKSITA